MSKIIDLIEYKKNKFRGLTKNGQKHMWIEIEDDGTSWANIRFMCDDGNNAMYGLNMPRKTYEKLDRQIRETMGWW